MKCRTFNYLLLILLTALSGGCQLPNQDSGHTRIPVDTIGFAQYNWQMDQVMERIDITYGESIHASLKNAGITSRDTWKTVISPHDDYAYAGKLYPIALRNVKAKTIFLFGVAHKARLMNLENQIIFDSHDTWKGPYGDVKVSTYREDIIQQLPLSLFQVNDSMHRMEHSLEALIPFLQYQNRELEIVPILVPYMPFEQMNSIAILLAATIHKIEQENKLSWGSDFAIVISNDAVHYGDEDWGGKNFARYGADSLGYVKALQHENEIIQTITAELNPEKIKQFCNFTVQEENYKEYKWTWCGRYSVPFGLLTSYHLNQKHGTDPMKGVFLEYSTSIEQKKLEFEDLQMGVTAPAYLNHWVGYAALGYY